MTLKHKPAQNPKRDALTKAALPKSSPASDRPWPPLIYHAHVPFYIKLRDLLITLAGWLLIVDLLEDIWVLITQWLHLTVFKRKVEMDHLMLTLWGNIHEFFYLSMTFMAVVVLVGLSRRRVLSRPVSDFYAEPKANQKPAGTDSDQKTAVSTASPRLISMSLDATGQLKVNADPSDPEPNSTPNHASLHPDA